MSDFDTRFFFSDEMKPEDWIDASLAVGEAHTDICREYPDRARILEHLPGINLTWTEAQDSHFYYPECHQWSAYHGDDGKISDFASFLEKRPWNDVDELFNVKKFAYYFTPYDREIDPPINLGRFEQKYPLHSRFMHYFCPPLQSAVSILCGRMVRGKMESLRLAREYFPKSEVIDFVMDSVATHYENPEYYHEPKLSEIEDMLFGYLQEIYRIIQPKITVIDAQPDDTFRELRSKLGSLKINLLGKFFEGAKFSRLMMGRILFYANDIPHFESMWLISHEMRRIRRMFFEITFETYGLIAWGEQLPPETVLERCRGDVLNNSDYDAVKAFSDIFTQVNDAPDIRTFAREVAAVMAPFQVVLEKLGIAARREYEQGVDE